MRSRFSGLAIGAPGTVAGMALALERYGTISLAQALAPAIRMASEGVVVTPDLADSLRASAERLRRWPATEAIFYKPDGGVFEPGDVLRQQDLADTLIAIARDGPDAFYRGPVATAIAEAAQQAGGVLTAQDLADYRAVVREPVRGTYRGLEIASMPPPSSGGAHLVQILNVLEGFDLAGTGHNGAQAIHWMAEAMKFAYADRSAWMGDPDFVDVPLDWLTSKAYAAALRDRIGPDATPSSEIAPGVPQAYESDQTTHFSVVDAAGNAVANTYTINFSYGSGIVAGGTGVLLNNEMDDFSAKPGVANAYGLIGGEANAVAPRKRPLSSMTPTIVLKDGAPYIVTGSPGGSRIITTTLQVILNVVDHGMNIAAATAAPRVHHQWLPDELRVEAGLSPDTLALLRAKGHAIAEKSAMGSTQSILIDPETGARYGASDPRVRGALTAGY
jgi:gamma-glutamyltranspeptidase/glutathione hydrolase